MTTLSRNDGGMFTLFSDVRNWWVNRRAIRMAWQELHDRELTEDELRNPSRIDRIAQNGARWR